MAMVVRSNLLALNANRQLGMNSSQASKSLEKLSSGYRINRASDDAAGLAISEKMKAQITGLNQASSNSQDGISLAQTAEGALGEVHNMLNRMIELATKSSNGTISDDVDREAIQDEVGELLKEIDRIGESTNFNGINLLDGTMASKAASVKASGTAAGGAALAATKATATAYVGSFTVGNADGKFFNFQYVNALGSTHNIVLTAANTDTDTAGAAARATEFAQKLNSDTGFKSTFGSGAAVALNGKITITAKTAGFVDHTDVKIGIAGTEQSAAAEVAAAGTAAILSATGGRNAGIKLSIGAASLASGATITVGGKVYTMGGVNTANSSTATFSDIDTLIAQLKTDGYIVEGDIGTNDTLTISRDPGATTGTGELTLQVGDTNDSFNKVTVKIDNVKTDGLNISGLDVSTQDSAGNSIQTIRDAINVVSSNRGTLGAIQNRLEHAISNLDSTSESMSGANSRIRDTDMAKEMMNYTKMNVLTQSAQSMLAQANQQPQSILQLLQ